MTAAVSAKLAEFALDTHWSGLPEAVRQEVQRALLNGVAAGLGGAGEEVIAALLRTMTSSSPGGEATLIGRSTTTDTSLAAFANAAAINVLDFDETHVGTIIHPVAPVAGAVLALSEEIGCSGQAMLEALVVGIEIACRIGNAVSPGHYARGWHITSTCGVFGAAAASARLLGLDQRQVVWALGIASAQSAGLVETLGTMAKSIGVGNAARAGLLAARLAGEGVEGPEAPLEGQLGFLAVTADPPDPDRALAGLGMQWELQRIMYKPYPCGVVLNPVIDACLALRDRAGTALGTIEAIDVAGSELLRMRTDRPDVTRGQQAQVSAQHAIAVTLLRGKPGAAEFADAAVRDATVLALRARVNGVTVDPEMAEGTARVSIRVAGGSVLTETVVEARGSLEAPMSDPELTYKLRQLAHYGTPRVNPDTVLRALADLPNARTIDGLMAALRDPCMP